MGAEDVRVDPIEPNQQDGKSTTLSGHGYESVPWDIVMEPVPWNLAPNVRRRVSHSEFSQNRLTAIHSKEGLFMVSVSYRVLAWC